VGKPRIEKVEIKMKIKLNDVDMWIKGRGQDLVGAIYDCLKKVPKGAADIMDVEIEKIKDMI